MKKFIPLLLTIYLFCPFALRVNAETQRYSRILNDNVVLYMDASMTIPWFTLPYGYYVKVINVSTTSAKVEYKNDNPSKPSVKGYIDVSELNFTEEASVLYPSLTLTVNQNCILYKDTDFSLTETVTQNSTVDFYGIYTRPSGEKYIFGFVVSSSGDKYIGYIKNDAVYDYTIPTMPVKDQSETAEPTFESVSIGETQSGNNLLGDSLQIVIIIAVSVVAISIVYLLFRPSGGKVKDEVITQNEFDDE